MEKKKRCETAKTEKGKDRNIAKKKTDSERGIERKKNCGIQIATQERELEKVKTQDGRRKRVRMRETEIRDE